MAFTLQIDQLLRSYELNQSSPSILVQELLAKMTSTSNLNIWITITPQDVLERRTRELEALSPEIRRDLPLYGVPYAVKDNIDVAGLPTTAACPAFAYTPQLSAEIVRRLEAAGAICMGKTNLDQFATGLVGTRSPYGACVNPFDPNYIAGGSSSGSAVAVAQNLVGFALGTDTAGSGRVPAALNGIVGLKPTLGQLSTQGIVPACRSLDCAAIFAANIADAWTVYQVVAGYDALDPFARQGQLIPAVWKSSAEFHFGIPQKQYLQFFGNADAETRFNAAVQKMQKIGGVVHEIDYQPFMQTAQLLYEGPWVAERYAAVQSLLESQPEEFWPITRGIIENGKRYSAIDTFRALYQLKDLQRQVSSYWQTLDFILLPTTGTIYTLAEVELEPLQCNSNLGYYTNFLNLLDLCAWAIPNGFQANGLPVGVSLVAPAWHEARLAPYAAAFLDESVRFSDQQLPSEEKTSVPDTVTLSLASAPAMQLAVFGLHLSGQPLNWQLLERGAHLVKAGKTAPCYRMKVVDEGLPLARPAAFRVQQNGVALNLEIWELPQANVGAFLARIRPPLGLGTVLLDDGTAIPGFISEGGDALASAPDISQFGGWLSYLAARAIRE